MNIYEVPEERRYWVVRAEGGRYYDHFVTHEVIALSHVNCLKLPDTPTDSIFLPELKELSESFIKHYTRVESKRQRTSVHLAQVKSFVYEMSVGDWVVTVGNHAVKFGRIGVKDRFGESGFPWELIKEFEVSAEHIAQMVMKLLSKK